MTGTTDRRRLLQEAIREIQRLKQVNRDLGQRQQAPLAIVGGACRFPGGINTLADFHRQQQEGRSAVSRLCDHPRFADQSNDPTLAGLHAALLETDPSDPVEPFDPVELFDANFFNIPAREAALMDPHQRLLLEVAHHALEDAGLTRAGLAGTETGVFVGTGSLDHALRLGGIKDPDRVNAYTGTGAALSINAGRLSYGLGLTGPSMVVDTACSSSLVAIHLACQSLRRGECRTAIAAGINLILAATSSQALAAAGVLSSSGACHTFAAAADGYVRGEGCAALILKTLSDAEADGDTILAVIHGSATNHDGASSGLTAPTGPAQARVIERALADAGLSADDIDYIEAHGTGTQLGDPIEVNVLGRLFGRKHPVAMGSAKTIIGHLEAAAGIAGVLRTALALHHGSLPAHLHFDEPNQHIPWAKLPLEVNTKSKPWPQRNRPPYAGVSSFGIGGSNAHLVLGGYQPPKPTEADRQPERPALELLTLSAHGPAALASLAQSYRDRADLADLVYGARHDRDHFPTRLALLGKDADELRAQLDHVIINMSKTENAPLPPRRLAMMIGGQGTQYAGMGLGLAAAHPVFRQSMDRCAAILHQMCDVALHEILADPERLAQTQYAQPAIFCTAYATAKLWQHWGLEPEVVFGHSVGEYVAACLAGIFSLETAVSLVAARGRAMQAVPVAGAMAAIHRDAPRTRALLEAMGRDLDIAAVNSPKQTVVAGDRDAVTDFLNQLKQKGIGGKLLPVGFGFHSSLMEPAAAAFAAVIEKAVFSPATKPIISNLTGRLDNGAMQTPQYWIDHIRQPVLFAASLQQAAEMGVNCFLEVGAVSVLTGLARQNLPDPSLQWLPGQKQKSKTDAAAALHPLFSDLGRWYTAGGNVDWNAFDSHHAKPTNRPKAPLYPFQQERFPLIGKSGVKTQVKETAPVEASSSVLDGILTLLADVLMIPKHSIDPDSSLLELGSDSVALADAAQKLERKFKVQLQLRQFFEDLHSPRLLAEHIAARTPAATVPAEPEPAATRLDAGDDAVAVLFQQQLDIMQRQLAVLEQRQLAVLEQRQLAVLEQRQLAVLEQRGAAPQPARAEAPKLAKTPPQKAGAATLPFGGLNLNRGRLSEQQQAHLDSLTTAYTARTAASKAYAAKSRNQLTDNRASAGFRFSTKEMLYPIVADRSQGAYFWDLDGNRFIDITMGFGSSLLGHQPDCVTAALQETLARGFQIGPQSALAGETAALLCRLTGTERAAFLNSGTEAIMTACRLARAKTGRAKIAMFAGSYHGHGDATLGSADEQGRTIAPIAGIPDSAVADMVILRYGDDAALTFIEQHGRELAAVLVEPVQSRNPALQPRAFLQRLRTLTRAVGCALIFDEMITGFRCAPGGAQAWFDVHADLCTYGKIAGGGMPIGVVAGDAAFMDALDGGTWQYGDASYPAADTTFFAGTFCKHPLTMAAAHAVLQHIETAGPALQDGLNQRTAAFAEQLNQWFAKEQVPIRIDHFASLFRFNFQQNLDLFFYHLVHQGVYIWEGRTCFFSAAHTEADIAAVADAVKHAVQELRRGGFLPGSAGSNRAEAVTPKSGNSRFPLSRAQQQMMLGVARDRRADSAYHLSADLDLNGRLDRIRLQAAYRAVQQRHQALRLRNDGEHQWAVEETNGITWFDLRETADPDAALRQKLEEAAQQVWDLREQAPCRALVFQLSEEKVRLHLRLHHVVADGWSAGLVLHDLWSAYAGETFDAPAPSFQNFLTETGGVDPQQRAYWLQRFRGHRFANPFPVRDRQATRYAGRRTGFTLPAAAIKTTAAARRATPFMVLLTAWCRRLQQVAETRDWVIATPSTGRKGAHQNAVVGYCTHLLPLRANPGGDNFDEQLDATRAQVLEAFENADVPFADWFEALAREQGPTPAPPALFNYEKAPTLPKLEDLAVTFAGGSVAYSAFPIILNAVDCGDHFVLACEYQTRYFDAATIAALCEGLRRDLSQANETPAQVVPATPAPQANQAPSEPGLTLSQKLAAHAAACPEQAALSDGQTTLTYAALYRRVQHLAADLRRRGIGPEKRVAVVAEPSIARLGALLAIWHSGGVAVVIDADQPEPRRRAMLQRLPIHCHIGTGQSGALDLQGWWHEADQSESTPCDPVAVDAANAVYLVHTSGSSGPPKPVCVTHGAYQQVQADLIQRYAVQPGDRVLQLVGLHFDVAMADVALALGAGACLVLAPKDCLRDGEQTTAFLAAQRISHVQIPPSALAHWPETDLPNLRHLVLGGETCPPALLTRWAAGRTLHNAYGPSETTITVCADRYGDDQSWTLGRALPACRLTLVDARGQAVEAGTPGELLIGGPTLARGYAGDARRTAATFRPDPFSTEPGARVYYSGDRLVERSDGRLEFLGRLDRQIKWRGLRIEPGEIEQVLQQCPGVAQAAVVFDAEAQRLDAYVATAGNRPEPARLRQALAELLPATHMPSSVQVLEAFPLTVNGKLDIAALPQATTNPHQPLQTQTEQQIALVWHELLHGAAVGADSHFFELGGHSLLAGQVRTRLRERFGIDLELPLLFEHPVLADLARVADQHQRRAHKTLTPAPADARIPLSSQQQRLWFLDQFDGPSATHNMPLALRLKGQLDRDALNAAVAALNQRHPMLCSFVAVDAGSGFIAMDPSRAAEVCAFDLTPLDPDQRERELQRQLAAQSQTPFQLEQGPLVRWALFALSEEEHVLSLTLHHLIADGWSMGVLLGDLTAAYNAACAGSQPNNRAEGLQYRDFAYHQQHRSNAAVSERFWAETLAGLPPLLALPTDHPRPLQQNYQGALRPVHFPQTLAVQVDRLAQHEGVTPFMVLLAAFNLLLADWSGQADIAVGTPVAGRDHGDLEQVVGLFLNTLVLRNHVHPKHSFAELLATVKRNSLAAFQHADTPFERVVDLLQPERSLAHAPLFQVMFILNNAPLPPLTLDGLEATPIDQAGTRSEFDLTLSLRQTENGYQGDLEYRTDLFEPATMQRLCESLAQVLGQVCRHPDRPLSNLTLIPAAEQQQLRALGSAPPLPPAALTQNIAARFEAWAARQGAAAAVVDNGNALSYAALNQSANQLAHHLGTLGRAPESQIGICLPRGAATVIAVLACLKAGQVYVPLDPRLPAARLASMVEHGKVRLLITNNETDEQARQFGRATLNRDTAAAIIARQPEHNPDLVIDPDRAAYAVFTSGSTGTPKAVVNTHGALASSAAAWLQAYDLQPHHAHLQMAAFSFDVWGGDLIRALCSGGRLVLCPAETLLDPPALYTLLREQAVSHAEFVPAVLRHLVQWVGDTGRRLDFMTMIITGSDLWYARDQAALEAVCGAETRLVNSYGLTEASIDSTWYQPQRGTAADDAVLPIGTAFPGVETWVLDRFGRLTATGVVGELYIGGPGLARCYGGDPAKTAAAFVPHPFSDTPGARLYRTGDLARRGRNGCLELVGRRDQQVKIRGFRIETADIEAHLTAHDQVQVAVVQARGDSHHRFLVCSYTGSADSDRLRAWLATRLPDYMVPSVWQHRDSMPLTANGKIDRLRLAQMEIAATTEKETEPVAAQGPAAVLQRIWQELLPQKNIGPNDNFFAAGGDSILSLQVVAKARHAGLTLTAKDIFEHQTLAELARVVTVEEDAATEVLTQQAVSGPVALTPIQIWFFQQRLPRAHHFNQALLFEQQTPLDTALTRAVLTHLANHHDQLRARFSQDALGAVVQWLPEQETADLVETVALGDLGDWDETRRRAHIAARCADLQSGLDLEKGPAQRVFLLDCGTAPSLLLWVCHHLIVDGVSWRILLEDFMTAYAQAAADQPLALPAKSLSFQQWAQQQQAAARADERREELAYWQAALPKNPTLPVDHPNGTNHHADLALVRESLDATGTAQLLHEIPQSTGLPLQTLLSAAVAAALAQWSNEDGALLEVESHGRGNSDVARTVGWFTAIYPLWLPVDGDLDRLLKETKERLKAVPNDGLGFGLLRTLHPDPAVRAAMAALPQPRVGFNYLGQLDGVLDADTPLQPVDDLLLGDIHRDNPRSLELEITAQVQHGRLSFLIDYSAARFEAATIEALRDELKRGLTALITHALADDTPTFTPSDFPNADLAQDDLDQLLTFLG
ncbi:non-ribosomal peptide synthetase/type I polyketide synthase [Acanthopleuribacter pedis]|uniref:Amino acid adenylation domain-containing protein n=1 Tax=Acanthopleuribacter pedis TaxID=442870 RepID=A0A8J7QJL3_9BACT|nr:non-ribosomal peptide synthetase/type I polyketide synthase [Acanthopleuribacter pedis]MBO1319418.1 amino acid adenylation domain-containing protein [Acanthopleuribacter pedis]